jgi:flagellin-specific chaperone FliS
MAGIYAHVRRELVRANVTKDRALVTRCRQIIEPLAATWQEALDLTTSAAEPQDAPGMVAP